MVIKSAFLTISPSNRKRLMLVVDRCQVEFRLPSRSILTSIRPRWYGVTSCSTVIPPLLPEPAGFTTVTVKLLNSSTTFLGFSVCFSTNSEYSRVFSMVSHQCPLPGCSDTLQYVSFWQLGTVCFSGC